MDEVKLPDDWGQVQGVPYNPLCGACNELHAQVAQLTAERDRLAAGVDVAIGSLRIANLKDDDGAHASANSHRDEALDALQTVAAGIPYDWCVDNYRGNSAALRQILMLANLHSCKWIKEVERERDALAARVKGMEKALGEIIDLDGKFGCESVDVALAALEGVTTTAEPE